MMRLNDATPAQWDALRKQAPAIEKQKTGLEAWMKAAHDEDSELWEEEEAAHSSWDNEVEDVVNIPDHYDMTTEEGRQAVWEMFANVNQDDDDDYEDEHDAVHNPAHYNTGSIECIEAIAESMSTEAFRGYLKGNCMKYLWRYDYKGKPAEDLQKASWYLQELTARVIAENS